MRKFEKLLTKCDKVILNFQHTSNLLTSTLVDKLLTKYEKLLRKFEKLFISSDFISSLLEN